MHPAFGDLDKGRQVAVMIQPDMELDGALGGAELRPGKHGQAQVNGGGVE